MYVDFFKRYVAGKFDAHHNHPSDPEKNYIEPGD